MSGTPSIPGWYITFQAAVLKQLPRPGKIDQATAEQWSNDQSKLSDTLGQTLALFPRCLKGIFTRHIPAAKEFVVHDHFVVDTSLSAKLRVCNINLHFQTVFALKIERDVGEGSVIISKIIKQVCEEDILAEIGADKAELALAHVYHFLKGAEHQHFWVFYVRDSSDVLCSVSALWCEDGWSIESRPVFQVKMWDIGHRVVSRT
jgi:hypothetical protein